MKSTIPSEKVEQGLFIPQKALMYNYGVYKVYVVERGLLSEKEVKIGERPNDDVEIVQGLKAGEEVALPVKGAELKDRAPVEIVE